MHQAVRPRTRSWLRSKCDFIYKLQVIEHATPIQTFGLDIHDHSNDSGPRNTAKKQEMGCCLKQPESHRRNYADESVQATYALRLAVVFKRRSSILRDHQIAQVQPTYRACVLNQDSFNPELNIQAYNQSPRTRWLLFKPRGG